MMQNFLLCNLQELVQWDKSYLNNNTFICLTRFLHNLYQKICVEYSIFDGNLQHIIE